jgi:hypothetical protein
VFLNYYNFIQIVLILHYHNFKNQPMSLIFTDTLQATDTSGLYTLQALIDNMWTDIHTIAGTQNGCIPIDATINTIAVDTNLLPVGHTFQFRWVDSIGNESNLISAFVPYTILDYYTADEHMTVANNGGDNWTFNVPYLPPPNDLADLLNIQVYFYTDAGVSMLVNQQDVTSSQSYNYTGNGAGTYMIEAFYFNNAGAHINISTAFFMVDGTGGLLRSLTMAGFTAVSFSGMDLSCTADYLVTNATVEVGVYFALDGTFSNQQIISLTNPLVNQQLPDFDTQAVILSYGVQLDQAEWTAGVAAQGNMTGCIMTLTTNIQ